MRTFTNKPGTVFDAEKTTVIFAEDMNEIVQALTPLPLSLADYWAEWRILTTSSTQGNFIATAISAGTITTALPAASINGYTPHGVFIRSAVTAGSGYRFSATSTVSDYFGQIAHKFFCDFMFLTSHTLRYHRFGFQDSSTISAPTDGAYFKIDEGVCVAVTSNNATRTTAGSTLTLDLSKAYRFDIEVNQAGTSARFRVFEIITGTKVYDETLTTNIPVTSSRAFGTSVISLFNDVTTVDIGVIYTLACGTVNGFLRSCGRYVSLPNS